MKKVFVSVTNDLLTDQRVLRTIDFLLENEFSVTLIGRQLQASYPENNRTHLRVKRFRLLFNKGAMFYACYNFRLFWYLVFRKKDFLLANDLDTLLANYWASKFSKAMLVYDSHELFTEVPELIHRPETQKKWEKIEAGILPEVSRAYTVCQPIADYYHQKYGTPFQVIRNLPHYRAELNSNGKLEKMANGRKIMLYQGALNIGRGLEQVIDAISLIREQVCFFIIGDGDITENLKLQVKSLAIEETVIFLGRLPYDELTSYTPQANLGISMEQPGFGLSYEYSLPNKLFDYIQAEVPVLGSNLSGIKSIIEQYQIGKTTADFLPEQLSNTILEMLNDTSANAQWKANLKQTKKIFCWEQEKQKLTAIFS